LKDTKKLNYQGSLVILWHNLNKKLVASDLQERTQQALFKMIELAIDNKHIKNNLHSLIGYSLFG
jgi:hypothetical protein